MDIQQRRTQLLLLSAIVLVALFNVFFMLGDTPLASWDESRHGVTAYEMLESGNFILTTYRLDVDYYNVKPVLSFLPQAAGIKIFGPNAFGLRFFSAFAFVLTLFCVFRIAYVNKGATFALLSGLIFVTSIRLITRHGARTGDADAVFVFLYCLALVFILIKTPSYFRFYIASFVAGLAFLTKSFHAAPLCLTIIILYLMQMKISRKAFVNGLGCCAAAIIPVGIWMGLRYQYDGLVFFEHMFFMDLLHRASEVMEGHNGRWYYYFIKLLQNFPVWLGALLVLLAMCLTRQKKTTGLFRVKDPFLVKLFIIVAIPFVMLTVSTSKLDWYLYSTFPFVSMLLAAGFIYWANIAVSRSPDLRRAIAVLLMISFVASEAVIVRNITALRYNRDPAQETIYQLGKEGKRQPLYLFVGKGRDGRTGWRQCLVLASKFYGDFVLMPWGIRGFEQFDHQDKFLIIDYK